MSWSNYFQERDAQLFVAHKLADKGWKLYGYRADESDSQTDYYSPASWKGIATHQDKPGVVICVSVSTYDATDSGKPIMKSKVAKQTPCESCNGTGVDSTFPWTLETARQNPEKFHDEYDAYRGDNGRMMIRTVVSPLFFAEDGRIKCQKCQGAGMFCSYEDVQVDTWPVFQATPKGLFWHVEKAGKIVAKGRGKAICAHAHSSFRDEDAKAKGLAVVQEILDATEPRHVGAKAADYQERPACTEFTIRRNEDKNGLELIFPAKPAQEILDKVKAAGFRWSRFSACWYTRYSSEAVAFAESLKSEL